MATLQSIRSKGPLLVIVIGVALLAFLAGDLFKVFQFHAPTAIAEVNGVSISEQDFRQKTDAAIESARNMYGTTNETQNLYIRDQVLDGLVRNELILAEAEELGLTVTEAELQRVIEDGTNPILRNAPIGVDQNTGRFSADLIKDFMVYYNSSSTQKTAQDVAIYSAWVEFEKQLKSELLAQKYISLISAAVFANNIEAEYQFEGRQNQYNALYAAVPYSSVPEADVTVSDSDLKKLYDKYKDTRFKSNVPSRDVHYIRVDVNPTDEDKAAIKAKVDESVKELKSENASYSSLVASYGSSVKYVDLMRSKDAFSRDIAARLDTVNVGEVVDTYLSTTDNAYTAFKLVAKANQADSVQFLNIFLQPGVVANPEVLADSICDAAKAGADFKAMAEKYNPGTTGETWVSTAQLNYAGIGEQDAKFFSELYKADKNAVYKSNINGTVVVTKVFDKKGSVEKYNVAVVKLPVEFSDATYNREYGKLSKFVAENSTLDKLTANAENSGYRVEEVKSLSANAHNIGGVNNTREALRWAILQAKDGEVSNIFECGEQNTFLVLVAGKKSEGKYVDFEFVKESLKAEALKEKRAEKILADLNSKGLKSIDDYKSVPNAVSDTLKMVTFSSPVNVIGVGAGEYALSGAVTKATPNQLTAPIKGNNAVYVLDVLSSSKSNETYDAAKELQMLGSYYQRFASSIIYDLFNRAEIVDNRYMFY